MNRIVAYISSLTVILLNLSSAAACPFCESETGQQVNAGIFNDQFWGNFFLTLTPFLILLVIVTLIYFDISWTQTRAKAAGLPTAPPTNGE